MTYVYAKVEDLDGTDRVGTGACAVLVQWYAKAPQARLWKEGRCVKGDHSILKGTGIATFVNGEYPNKKNDNHAALYIKQDAGGIWVVDQWQTKPKVTRRYIRFKGLLKSGSYLDPSNNGDAFSVIE